MTDTSERERAEGNFLGETPPHQPLIPPTSKKLMADGVVPHEALPHQIFFQSERLGEADKVVVGLL